ncbi:MAG: hypothetical protein LRY71_03350 [Bacillaceae bacterium]|nr:hypothetical protein [Bacillaceae bacterium]
MTKKTGLEIIPGLSVDKLFRYTDILAEAPKTDMRSVSAAYLKNSEHPIITRITVNDRQLSGGGEKGIWPRKASVLVRYGGFSRRQVGWLPRSERNERNAMVHRSI